MTTTPKISSNTLELFERVRRQSLELLKPLSPEDACVQSMPDASPAKWHLAHTTWFYETFILELFEPNFTPHDKAFRDLFNSYYNGIGKQYPRDKRGLLTKPSLEKIKQYAAAITARILKLKGANKNKIANLIELGCHHEQQHQELIIMDVKHLLSCNPLKPAYKELITADAVQKNEIWMDIEGGIYQIGSEQRLFSFDNEKPRHDTYFKSFKIKKNLISNEDYLAFIEDDGYQKSQLWLADGWSLLQTENWVAPAYWEKIEGDWFEYTTKGVEPLDFNAPVCHVSYYEADAFANWADSRLPTEQEWEITAEFSSHSSNKISNLFNSRWQWTQSSYSPYPGFRASRETIGEYNGKFMSNQIVLRGSSIATPSSHSRTTYRNFFYPHQRWAFTGIRLCKDV